MGALEPASQKHHALRAGAGFLPVQETRERNRFFMQPMAAPKKEKTGGLPGGGRQPQIRDLVCKCSELRYGEQGCKQYAAGKQQESLGHGSDIFQQRRTVLKVRIGQPVEQVNGHRTRAYIREKCLSDRNQQHDGKGHGKAYGIAGDAPEYA